MLFSFGRCKMTALHLCAFLLFVTISNAQGPQSTPSLKGIEPDGIGDSSKRVLPWKLKNIKPISKYIDHHRRDNVNTLSRQGGLSGIPYYGMNQPLGLPFGSPYGSNQQSTPFGNNAQISPYGTNPQVSPYGTNPQVSPYGSNPQVSPYGTNPQGSPYGTNPQGSPYETSYQGSPYGTNSQGSLYGINPQVSPYGTNSQGSPRASYGAQYSGGYSTGNVYGQYSSSLNPYVRGQRMRAARTMPELKPEINKIIEIKQDLTNHAEPLVYSHDMNNNESNIRRHIGGSNYPGHYKDIPSKISGAYPHHFSSDEWSYSHPPKQKIQQPVAAVSNFEEYICAIYNKNLLTTWRMLSNLISDHNLSSPGKDVLKNLLKLIRIYLNLHNGNTSDEEKEINLRESGNILMEASNPGHHWGYPHASQRQPNVKKPKFTGFSTEISDVPIDDNTVGLDVVFPVPKNKCQESALDSLVDTFKNLYIQYLTHVDKCDVSHL